MLHLRAADAGRVALTALVVVPADEAPPRLTTCDGEVTPVRAAARLGREVWLYRFVLRASAEAAYTFDDTRHRVGAAFADDLRIAFTSCNGQEEGDLDRDPQRRNVMWRALLDLHRAAPLNLLLHGGDQIYADEVTRGHPATRDWPDDVAEDLDAAALSQLSEALADAYFARYLHALSQDGFAQLSAEVPCLSMWDDHDICDGWGSLDPRLLDSAAGRRLFAAARDAFLLFQTGTAPGEVPEICLDRGGGSLAWAVHLPDATLLAPDLRSERRPDRVMAPDAWAAFERELERMPGSRLLLVSSVPALGPRLSLVERAMQLTPWAESYEDDLRDQWQSRAHREEWRRLLRALVALREDRGRAVTVLSGEIHLATRATMRTGSGDVHQLVASGISHPAPPQAYALGLGTLARLGEAPLRGHPIRLRPLPGRRRIYAAERNFLVLAREKGDWWARWHLEESGPTPVLAL